MPELRTEDFDNQEIFSAGTHNNDKYSVADLDAMVDAFGKVGYKVPLKLGHSDSQKILDGEELPAIGWVENLRRSGNKLLADFKKVPGKLADLIKAGGYRGKSSEIYWDSKFNGTKFPRALKAVSLLGMSVPAVSSLNDICSLYADNSDAYAYEESEQEFRVYADTGPYVKKEGDKWCAYGPNGEKMGSFDSEEEAQDKIKGEKESDKAPPFGKNKKSDDVSKTSKSGGKEMEEKDVKAQFEEMFAAREADLKKNIRFEVEKEFEYKVMKAREDGKAEILKEKDQLEEEVRKLQSEKRSERIEHWIKTMKTEGKLLPVEESKVRAMREWITDDGPTLKYFTLKNGKTESTEMSPADLFESLFSARPTIFKTLSTDDQGSEDEVKEYTDAGAEVDRRAKLHMRQQAEKNIQVNYSQAVKLVLAKDGNLAQRYNQESH